MSDFTQILNSATEGDERSSEALLKQVYEDLHKLAQARMVQESPNHTLQPTALVHEAWLSLVDDEDRTWQNRAYFFASAATAMRRILIDHARKKATRKHGGHHQRLDIDQLDLSEQMPDDMVLMVEDALQKLETRKSPLGAHRGDEILWRHDQPRDRRSSRHQQKHR